MNKIYNLLIRYAILLIVAFPSLWIFYTIFTPLTIYPVFFVLSLFYDVLLLDNILIINNFAITIIEACIAGSAYFLLLILNLTTPMKIKQRLYGIFFSFVAFLVLNIIRITIFSTMFVKSFSLFDMTHLVTWYLFSGILVFVIWLAEVKIFKIKNIPAYSDIKYLYNNIKK